MAESAAPIAKGGHWHWQQTMLRIKDPKASVAHYTENYGMTLIAHLQFPQWTFDLYFLTTLPEGTEYTLDPKSKEAEAYCFQGDYGGHENVALELTHNYGTEELEGPVYHGGNAMECPEIGENGRDGFGHIAFNVDDVYAACDALEAKGCTFKKKPNEGRMMGLAFVYDPDGYWVEIVKRGETAGIANAFNLSQTMFRIKDPSKTIPFYEACGLTLVRSAPHEGGKFTNFFMANLSPALKAQFEAEVGEKGTESAEAVSFMKNLFIPVLEMTHNWGTESDESFQHFSGNEVRPGCGSDGRGFGHIGFLVDDVYTACEVLEPLGYGFKKKPDEGGMKGLAFAYDPDGYWVEILKRGGL